MKNQYDKLISCGIKDFKIFRTKRGIVYETNPDRAKKEVSARILLEWDNKSWIAFREGNYDDIKGNAGYFCDGPFALNEEACSGLCKFFNFNIGCLNKKKIEILSRTSPDFLGS